MVPCQRDNENAKSRQVQSREGGGHACKLGKSGNTSLKNNMASFSLHQAKPGVAKAQRRLMHKILKELSTIPPTMGFWHSPSHSSEASGWVPWNSLCRLTGFSDCSSSNFPQSWILGSIMCILSVWLSVSVSVSLICLVSVQMVTALSIMQFKRERDQNPSPLPLSLSLLLWNSIMLQSRIAWKILSSPGWPWICVHPLVLGLQARATTPRQK